MATASTLPPDIQVRLKALEVASNQHLRMNAVAAPDLIRYATALEAYVLEGSKPEAKADTDDDGDPLS